MMMTGCNSPRMSENMIWLTDDDTGALHGIRRDLIFAVRKNTDGKTSVAWGMSFTLVKETVEQVRDIMAAVLRDVRCNSADTLPHDEAPAAATS